MEPQINKIFSRLGKAEKTELTSERPTKRGKCAYKKG